MKGQLAGVELTFMVTELQCLLGGKVDKIYHPSKEEIIITIHVPSKGKHILNIVSGKLMYLSQKRESAGDPTNFCMFLRKHLEQAKLIACEQIEAERIIRFIFERKDERKTLVAELFAPGNVLLLDQEELILSALVYHKFKDRDILAKTTYSYPHSLHPFISLNKELLSKALASTTKDSVATFLAVDIGLGGLYAEELCLRAKLDKKKSPSSLSSPEQAALCSSLKSMLSLPLDAVAVLRNDIPFDVTPFKTLFYENEVSKSYASFSEAIEESLPSLVKKASKDPHKKEIEKLESILHIQEKTITEYGEKEEEARAIAETIFSHYQEIESLLKEFRELEKKHSWQKIKDTLKGHAVVKEVNPKEKKVTVRFN